MKQDGPPESGTENTARRRFLHCAGQGLLKHAVPAAFGGNGDRFADLVKAHHGLGHKSHDPGLLLALNAHIWGALFPLLNYGSNAQQAQYICRLLSGEWIGGHAITEPQAGSDLQGLTVTAVQSEQGFELNGRKRFITNAPIADMLVVYARLDQKLTAFLVHHGDSGADFLDTPKVTGCRTASIGDVCLSQCRLPRDRQLGKPGAGNQMIQQALELERAFVFAGISGVMAWQLDYIIQFSRERRVSGSHLGKHQAISHKIAEMKIRLDTVRLWVNECARLKDSRQRLTLASAQTKCLAAEAFLQSSLDAVHILGGSGLLEDQPMASLVNDAMASRLFSGSSEIQKNIIAALLGTGDGFRSA